MVEGDGELDGITKSVQRVDVFLHFPDGIPITIAGDVNVNVDVGGQIGVTVEVEKPTPTQPVATHAVLVVVDTQGDNNMPGQITVDTTNETATVLFVDDKGDTNAAPPTSPDGTPAVVTFTSDNTGVLTIATDSANPLQGDVTPVAEGTANVGATIADDNGNPILEPDGVTPFSVESVLVTVSAGEAQSAELSLSV